MRTVRAVLVATAVLAVAVTAGCSGGQKGAGPAPTSTTSSAPVTPSPKPTAYLTGVGKLPATEILARAKAALKAADSFRISGRADVDGSSGTLDVALTSTGGKAVLVNGATRMTVITLGQVSYIQGNDAFWKSVTSDPEDGAMLAARFRGKWLKTATTAKEFGDLSALTDKNAFADQMVIPESYSKIGPALVRGSNCIGLRASDTVVWIDQVTSRPIVARTSGGKQDLVFTDYNRVQPPQAPPANLVVDQSDLH